MEKPKSIKAIGLIVSILGGVMMGSNFMGGIAGIIIDYFDRKEIGPEYESPFRFIIPLAIVLVLVGFCFLIGGNHLRKYKLWAKRLLTISAGVAFVSLWTIPILMLLNSNGLDIFNVPMSITGVIFSVPMLLLILFLQKKKIKKHFA